MLLHEKLKDKKVILASRSPRRRQLMEGAGIDFSVACDYEVEEIYPPKTPACDVPLYLARLKSAAYPVPLLPGEILITADTVVILDGDVLGKPADREDALRILERLSGRQHTVVTGVVMRDAGASEGFSVNSKVRFRQLRREEIEFYVDNYSPMDKAGAYGIQEWIGYAGIVSVEGSFYNVMGLPIQSLYVNLEKFIER